LELIMTLSDHAREDAPNGRRDPLYTVIVAGEIDMVRATEFDDLVSGFEASGAANAQIDLRQVTFIDSTGLGALARIRQIAVDRGGRVTLVGPGRATSRLLTLVGMDEMFEIIP
jgi:anti-sigma B factor antagonist